MCSMCRRHSTENNSWSHSHTKRGLPEMLPSTAGPLELTCTCRSDLRFILLRFTHVLFSTNQTWVLGTLLSSDKQSSWIWHCLDWQVVTDISEELAVTNYQSARSQIPDDYNLHRQWCANLNAHSVRWLHPHLLGTVSDHSGNKYRGADKSLARHTSRCILFDGENILFDASLVI
jgi:hypothetical protein